MTNTKPSLRSRTGLNATNFFLAELVGVILPFLSSYLKDHGWNYADIGIALAIGGMGTLLNQIPAGIIADRVEKRKTLLTASTLILGASYALLPLVAGSMFGVSLLLFLSGAANAFFVPLLAALALSLVGRKGFDALMGENQSWNHAGNIAAALMALILVRVLGVVSIFYVMAFVSALAASSLILIKGKELNPDLADGPAVQSHHLKDILKQVAELLSEKTTRTLIICVALFHLANAPVMPMLALYLKHLGSGDDKIAFVVLIAQAVMIPVAFIAAKYGASHGRKPVFAIAFIALPLRIALYAITTNPNLLLAIQMLDGIGAGIYGVIIALICADLTRGKQGFNTLLGIMQTALALGGVAGPLLQGFLVQHLGFPIAFLGFAGVATLGAALFLLKFPETRQK